MPALGPNAIAMDTETKGLAWFEPDEQAFLGSWATDRGEWHEAYPEPAEGSAFLDAMCGADTIVCHNLAFDVHQVRATWGLDILNHNVTLHDSDLMSRILLPEGQRKDRGGHGLKNLSEVFLKADAKKEEDAIKAAAKSIGLRTIKRKGAYWQVWRAYPDLVEQYARADARYTYDLAELFLPRLKADPQLWALYQLEMQVAPILIRAEARGTAVSSTVVEQLWKEYSAIEDRLRTELERELGPDLVDAEGEADDPFDLDSRQDLAEALLMHGVPLTETTKTGDIATNKFALQVFEQDYPIIATLFEWRRTNRFLSTYLAPMRGREVVHPSFQQAEAWTGRMSCRRPNMQNLPKAAETGKASVKLRSMFVPRPGHKFVVADYEGIEVHLLAHYLGSRGQPYRDLIRQGLDAHAYMAQQLPESVGGGGPYESYLKGTPGEKVRGSAKNGMFAITYGAGGKRLTDMFNLDPGPWYDEDAPQIRAARARGRDWPKVGWQYAAGRALASKIKSGLPGYHALNKRIRRKIEEVGHVRTLMGRKQLVDKEKSYVGLNALIQGSAADIMKQGLVLADAAIQDLGGHVLLVVHDEIVAEVPDEYAEEALRRIEAAMIAAAEIDPPLEVEGSIVDNYGDA